MHNTEIALRKSRSAEGTRPQSRSVRLALLTTCLESTETFFTQWLSLPVNLYHCLPMNLFALAAHAAIILGMLNLFRYDGWDLHYVREKVSFAATMDNMAVKFEEASRETDNKDASGCSAFWRSGLKMKKLRDWYEARLTGPLGQQKQGDLGLMNTLEATTNDVTAGFDFDMLDESIWNDFMTWTAYDAVQ
jgi:hypothetical protein